MRAPRRSIGERVAARIVTGPLGHLYGGVADWLELLVRWQVAKRRAPRG